MKLNSHMPKMSIFQILCHCYEGKRCYKKPTNNHIETKTEDNLPHSLGVFMFGPNFSAPASF